MAISDSIKNIKMSGRIGDAVVTNTPKEFKGSQLAQYYSSVTAKHTNRYAKYACDFVSANVQGLNPGDFFAWQQQNIRFADATRPTAGNKRTVDDFKFILFEDERIDYIPVGAKIETMGSTWLVVNPSNGSNPVCTALVQKCNATWNGLDYYGNIVQEPMIVTNHMALANNYDDQETMLISRGYFDVMMQLNPFTAQLANNSRVILGSGAYMVTGYSDFIQEFTGNTGSTHAVYFTLRVTEPNDTDDMENHVAGGNDFSWDVAISGSMAATPGGTSVLSATSTRNGEVVTGTSENPISYVWESSDPEIASVSGDGYVVANAEGTCEITATLAQNPAQSNAAVFTVTGGQAEDKTLLWKHDTQRHALEVGDEVTLEAALYIGGAETEQTVTYTYGNAADEAYSVDFNGNAITVMCWCGSVKPLVITAETDGMTITKELQLVGI